MERVSQLERLNATLAAEVDRLRPLAERGSSEVQLHLVNVLLLCSQCKQPIRARITTCNWIRAEWIGSEGECARCHQKAKSEQKGSTTNLVGTGANLASGR